MRNLKWIVPLTLLIGACSAAPEDVAQQYLDAITSGDRATMDELFCIEGAVEWNADVTGAETAVITQVEDIEVFDIPVTYVEFDYSLVGIEGLSGSMELTESPLEVLEASQEEAAKLGLTPEVIDPATINNQRPCVIQVRQVE